MFYAEGPVVRHRFGKIVPDACSRQNPTIVDKWKIIINLLRNKEDAMQIENIYIQQLKENLSELNPYLVLLFGSYANGTPNQDSDLDIFVVLNDNSMPTTFKEKQALYLKVSSYTRSVSKQIPIDLMVFTIPMFEKFKTINSSFSKEILNKGIVLYESDHTTMA